MLISKDTFNMSRVSKLVDDDTYNKACQELKNHGNLAKISIKLKAIIAAKTHSITQVADVFGITRKSLMTWIKEFKDQGKEGLSVQSGRGRNTKIHDDQIAIINEWVKNNPNITIKELKMMITEHFMIDVSMMTAHRILKNYLLVI
jgi:transposase